MFIQDKSMHVRTVVLMLCYTWQVTCHAVHNDTSVYRLTRVVFFASTHLCTHKEPVTASIFQASK